MRVSSLVIAGLLSTLAISNISWAKNHKALDAAPISNSGANTVVQQSKKLQDVAYNFDSTKLDASQDAFHFLRSFVDYFYLVIKNNPNALPSINSLSNTNGWAVGDAHAENFGVLLKQNNDMVFTHNDMDDSGPAPVIYDIYRLMVSSKLYDQNIDLNKMMSAYLNGLNNRSYSVPGTIQDMLAKASAAGTHPSKKKVQDNKIVRDQTMEEVDADTLATLKGVVSSLKNYLNPKANLIDTVKTAKVGGGSGGLNRYELLIDNGGSLLDLELKTEVTPSIYPVASAAIPEASTRIATTVLYDQGNNPSPFYQTYHVGNADMLLRPRFAGNVGVNLDKQSPGENEEIIYYESYTLGQVHARSVNNLSNYIRSLSQLNMSGVQADVQSMVDLFNYKYSSLKH